MGDAQRRFRVRGARRPGKEEAEVARAVGRRGDDLAGLHRDGHAGDPGYRLRGGEAVEAAVDAAPWTRDLLTAGGPGGGRSSHAGFGEHQDLGTHQLDIDQATLEPAA